MYVPYTNIPYYDYNSKEWSTKSFDSQKEFGQYILDNCFKEPGEYGLDDSTDLWNEHSKTFTNSQSYTSLIPHSSEWIEFWHFEKRKSRLGFFWKNSDKIWYVPKCYYFFLNYCPITNKEKDFRETFVDIRDVQLHLSLYIKLAEIFDKNACIIKRRQMAYSFFMAAKSANLLFFEKKKIIKWFASDESFLDSTNGTWSMFDVYRNHISQHTPWDRVFTPSEFPEILQKEKIQVDGKWITRGNESKLIAKTLSKDAKRGVGGPCTMANYEEGGIAPTADTTYTFMLPAIMVDEKMVGVFIIGGSVGDLKQCKPLQSFIENPENNHMFAVDNKWVDETGVIKKTGLFIPSQYGMASAVDKHGNSLVEKAFENLEEMEKDWKKLDNKQYLILKSQNPKNLKEAFDYREDGEFDSRLISRKQDRLKELNKTNSWTTKPIKCTLFQDDNGKICINEKNLPEEIGYPVQKGSHDKRGVVIIYEKPEPNPPLFTYFAGVDPVEVGASETSKSVFSISIWKRATEKEYKDEYGNIKLEITGDKMVACWRGRFDSVDKTNEYAEWLIKMYNAYTLVERNKPNFINHFQRKGLTHLLAKESELPLFKDMNVNGANSNSNYGFYKGSNGKASEILNQFIEKFKEYLYAEYGAIYKKNEDGSSSEEVIKIFRGLDRIDDYWFLEELKLFSKGSLENFDRIISDLAGYYIMKIYSIQGGVKRIKYKETKGSTIKKPGYFYNYTSTIKNTNLLKY